jgi:hypothetical protein
VNDRSAVSNTAAIKCSDNCCCIHLFLCSVALF